jgi:hypothetical protein
MKLEDEVDWFDTDTLMGTYNGTLITVVVVDVECNL